MDNKQYMDVLLEKTVAELMQQTDRHFPNRSDASSAVRIKKKDFIKSADNQLMVRLLCHGETNDYEQVIIFKDVEFTDASDPEGMRIDDMFIKPLKRNQDVAVNCTCLDFHWTFAWHNAADNALHGNPPEPYTPTGTRPPRNPAKVSGLCKHLIKAFDDLDREITFT